MVKELAEARAQELQRSLQVVDAAWERYVAYNLVRYACHFLHDESLITDEEFAALVADHEHGQRVARLEAYEVIKRFKRRADKAEARVRELEEKFAIALNSLRMFKAANGASADQFVSGATELHAALNPKEGASDEPTKDAP